MKAFTAQKLVGGTVALLLAVGLSGCTGSPAPADEALSLSLSGTTEMTFDPADGAMTFNNHAMQAVYDTLLIWNQDADTFDPWLASSLELSDDRTVATLSIRDDANFSDGEHVDAAAIKANFDAVMASSTAYLAGRFQSYGIEFVVLDEYELEIRATKPLDHPFWEIVILVPIASPVALEDPESLAKTPVGSGPYLLDAENSTQGIELNFTRSDDYWNRDAFPYETVTVKAFADDVAGLNALLSGQIDATSIPLASAVEAESKGFTINTASGGFRTLVFGGIDGTIAPPLADVKVRQAINLAFDREAITEQIDLGFGTVSSQPFTEGQQAFIDEAGFGYGFDPERARELLAEAGYEDGFDIVMPGAPDTDVMEPIVQQALSDIGIRVTFERFAEPALADEAISAKKFAMWMDTVYFVNTIPAYLTPGGALYQVWGEMDPTVTELVNTINFGTAEEVAEASQEIGRFLNDEAWFSPFSQPAVVWASATSLEVFQGRLTGLPQLSGFQPAK